MPELPEVESVVRSLQPSLTGRVILSAEFSSRLVARQDFAELRARLSGQRIHSIRRHGKFILFELDRGALAIHLGMTGKLLVGAKPSPYARAIFSLDGGTLVYDDIRQFGRIEWSEQLPDRIAALGPDALSISREDFIARLKLRNSRIKPLLLNQTFLRGLGNIYTDEALFAARIHPKAIARRLSRTRGERLHREIYDVLQLAIRHKGSSISDYVDGSGEKGSFQSMHQVYGREGEPCTACGGKIRRIVVGQRGTHYCPSCQRI